MRRRGFLLATGSGLLAMLGPAWLQSAFGDASLSGALKKEDPRFGVEARRRAYQDAAERARKSGRALLVFVIPRDQDLLWDRGHAFGELLEHGTTAQLAPLSKVELACATLDDLGVSAAPKSDPVLALVSPGGGPPPQLYGAELPSLNELRWPRIDRTGKDHPVDEDAFVERRIAVLAKLLAEVLGPVPASRGSKVQARYAKEPPAGTHWATTSACGPAEVEETRAERAAREAAERNGQGVFGDVVGYGCGAGHVPDKSRRFLYFFTEPGQ